MVDVRCCGASEAEDEARAEEYMLRGASAGERAGEWLAAELEC